MNVLLEPPAQRRELAALDLLVEAAEILVRLLPGWTDITVPSRYVEK
jgi:hypothetical protein